MKIEADAPVYKSHKKVRALELSSVHNFDLTFKDEGFKPVTCEEEMFVRYHPVPGDFLVFYEDGYKSFSPRKAFLDGYTRI